MVVYCVMGVESHVGEFLLKIFSTKEKAENYIEVVKKIKQSNFDDFEIDVREVDE